MDWTKRQVLSATASVYDPLGLIAPITIRARALMQRLTGQKLQWDQKLDALEDKRWRTWLEDVNGLKDHEIDRYIGIDGAEELTLHIFVDASTQAYAAAAYIRAEKDTKGRRGPNKDSSRSMASRMDQGQSGRLAHERNLDERADQVRHLENRARLAERTERNLGKD